MDNPIQGPAKQPLMNEFQNHNYSLRNYFESIIDEVDAQRIEDMICLDSADSVLRGFLTINEMRAAGSFFTGQLLTTAVVGALPRLIDSESKILDPTCGMGNLLIECSRSLPISNTLSETLESWGNTLFGYDLFEVFIESTKLRLILEAIHRGATKDCSIEKALSYFSGIKQSDAMSLDSHSLSHITHVVMNPPFSSWDSPQTDYWKSGKVNAAGVIYDHFVRVLPLDCSVSAILPDVLRTGTRYEEWRGYAAKRIHADIQIAGRFSNKTDVDVFIMSGILTAHSEEQISWFDTTLYDCSIAHDYEVCIGPLVAYRDPEEGTLAPYIHSKNTPSWEKIETFPEHRKFKGRLIPPPFVVIRRTSSPTDRFRATGSIINGSCPVAVENHLIVVKPKNSSLRDCEALLEVLQMPRTNDFLNNRIRCRHLTVAAVKDIAIR